MVLSVHFLVGAIVATKAPNLFWGLPLAYFSHYLFDLLPAWEYDISAIYNRRWGKSLLDFFKVFLDIVLGVSLILFLSESISTGLLGGFLAILADGLTLLFVLLPRNRFLDRHYRIHMRFNWLKNKKIPLFFKIATEGLVYLFAIFFLQ